MAEKHVHIQIPEAACKVIGVLEGAGFEAWVVGGFVRDAVMGREADDVDVTTNALWTQSKPLFERAGFATFETGVAHGTLTVAVDHVHVEVTTYRSDGRYSDGRHPDNVTFVQSIDDDLARRDFTVNAMAYHPARGLRDPYGGMEDIRAGIIRTVGDPAARFSEDSLRILRAARFQSQLGFTLEERTARAANALSATLGKVAVERQVREWDKLLCGAHVHDAIMGNTDVLGATIPEILPMRGFDQHSRYHCYDVLEHTAYVVQYVNPTPLLRWAALFHDIGKPEMFAMDEHGHGHFKGHAVASRNIAERAMKRLKMSPRFIHKVLLLVQQHDDRINPEPKAVKRRLAKLDGDPQLFLALCDLKRADSLAHAPAYRRQRAVLAGELEDCLGKILEEQQAFQLRDLAVDGNDVIACGVEPGPQVGRILQRALEAVIDDKVPNERAALLSYVQSIKRP